MLIPRFILSIFSIGLIVLGAGIVVGQDYPNKSVRIVTSSVGGGSDFTSRLIAQGIAGPLGQPVVVENRGGGGSAAAEVVAKAPPDGHVLLVNGGTFWISTLLRETPYDVLRDFLPITMTSRQPNILAVHPTLPVKSVKELIALAKTRPGELNYVSGGVGSIGHLGGELFKSMAGINMVHVAYQGAGGGTALTDLMSGQVHLTFGDGTSLTPHIKTGRLRALAVTSLQPSALFPGIPTVAAALPGYEVTSVTGVFAPAKTRAAVINRLNYEIVRFLNTAEAKERLFSIGSEVVGSSPEELTAAVKSDMATMGKVIKDAGIRIE